jgi:hypothetical protein
MIFIHGPSSPIGRTQLGLAALFVSPTPKKMDGKADRAVDEEPYINKRKLSSTTPAKGDLTNGPSPKKWMEMATESLMTNHSSTRGSHRAHRL